MLSAALEPAGAGLPHLINLWFQSSGGRNRVHLPATLERRPSAEKICTLNKLSHTCRHETINPATPKRIDLWVPVRWIKPPGSQVSPRSDQVAVQGRMIDRNLAQSHLTDWGSRRNAYLQFHFLLLQIGAAVVAVIVRHAGNHYV